MAQQPMTTEQLLTLQQRFKYQLGIGPVEFAERFLGTPYDTYKKWRAGTNPISGAAANWGRFFNRALDNGWTLEEIIAVAEF